ncbi:MAG: valine--tRNA ligase [Candidatus Gottesmanbacteria bacterium]
MDKAYTPKLFEETIYSSWEKEGYFSPKKEKGKEPFCVILPLPNANGDLHLGHAMFTIEDIMIRYHRMKGDATLWQSGFDHAGFETQFVFEKFLAKQGKSRFDYSRDELYKAIWDFTQINRGNMESQLRRMGFSLDWSRVKFPLDPEIIAIVYRTFKKMHDEGLIYRGERLVNYCTKCGTSFSDLEIKHIEQVNPLYYLKYGPFILATIRPETKFGDTAVAVHPKDKRYASFIGKDITFDGLIGEVTLHVVGDEAVDPAFGTGVVKVTPAHDMTDYEIGKRHNLKLVQVIGFDGKLTAITGPYAGLRVKAARQKTVEDLQAKGMMDHVDEGYVHTVGTCYRCGTVLEPLPMSQWFVKVRPLADQAIKIITKKEVTFIPKRFEKTATQWLTDFHDWNISRQIVWGIRIPAWRCENCTKTNPGKEWIITDGTVPTSCPTCGSTTLVQDEDVFDTWFSSAQWPFATLQANSDKTDFDTFYPTSVMETGYDILPMWVCRMLMVGLYVTGSVPFKKVYLHGLVRDSKGQKMSKSKGNVVNPIKMVDQYGADALRIALVFGVAAGNDISLSEDKIRGMRNFANKLWNIARLFLMNTESTSNLPFYDKTMDKDLPKSDLEMIKKLEATVKMTTKYMDTYRYSDAAQTVYDFTWHTLADEYLEENKERFKQADTNALLVYRHILLIVLKLLHPFMPFITENIWGQLPRKQNQPLIISSWPTE